MKKLWNKIKAHFSGWPEGAEERIQQVEKKEEIVKKSVEESHTRKAKAKTKKPKGLNPKKKKKARKQGNIG